MRIVAHNGARIWGGAERATVLLLRGLSDRGHDVVLLCNDSLVMNEAKARGVNAELCPIGGDIAVPHTIRLSSVLRTLDPDVFLIGTWKKLFLASLGARMAAVPRVVARVGLETDTARSAKYRFALRRWVDGIAVNAARMLGPFEALAGFDPRHLRLIHNGVRRPSPVQGGPDLRASLGIGSDDFVLGAVGRLAGQKRFDRLLEALALTDASVRCIISGDGEEKARLVDIADSLGLTRRVHFLGHREDLASVYAAIDTLAITSDREGLSNSMLEAMACGIPIVTTPVSGASDAIEGDAPAGIITTFEPKAISQTIEHMRINVSRRKEMGEEAMRRADTVFSFERMVDRWEEFLAGAPAS